MECLDLQALPFDVVVLVFQFLDPRSLLAACLTSKSFHEIATPLLYEDVQLGPSPRCHQGNFLSDIDPSSRQRVVDLRAWPQERLRNVRHLDTWPCYPYVHKDQREKIGELLNVSSLRCLRYPKDGHWCIAGEGALIDFVINKLPPLRELFLDVVDSGIRNGQLARLERLSVCFVEDWGWLIRETTASLKCLRIERSLDYDIWTHIAKLTSLVSLFIGGVHMWKDEEMSFLEMLSNLARLENLHISGISKPIYNDLLPSPTGLTKLRDVTLKFVWGPSNQDLEGVSCFLDYVTSSSRLRRLKVQFTGWDIVQFRGEKFITGILAKHSKTLDVLRLPQFHPPEGICTRIFSCLKLKRLSIGVTSLLMDHLPVLLTRTTTLERLSLMTTHHHARLRSTQLRQLLYQGTSLHSVKLRILKQRLGMRRAGIRKAEWRAVWEYSEEFQCPRRVIIGPAHYKDPVYNVDVKAAAVQQPTQVIRTSRRSYTPEVSSEMSEGSYMQEDYL